MKLSKAKWPKVKLHEVCEIDPSKREISDLPNEIMVSFAEMADLKEHKPQFTYSQEKPLKEVRTTGLSYFRDNDVLLAKMTPCFENGKSGLAKGLKNGIGFGSTEFFVLRGRKIISDLIYYLVESDLFIQKGKLMMVGTTGRKRLMKDFVANYEIPLPPLSEQKQIAELFQSIEAAMEQVEGQERNLRTLQKSIVNGLVRKIPIFGNLLNDKNCSSFTFGEIADCDKKYPEHEQKVERFVGLENIEPDNFQLQGYGLVENGTTFSKRFCEGDVLFGKRRAYLKKVAVADFDGICSGDILVIRAKSSKMLQGLLPFYIAADAFIQHAVSTSAGSLSPRTKWKDLADFEISIPDIKIQEKILAILSQFDNTINQLKQQKVTLKNLKQKLLNEILG